MTLKRNLTHPNFVIGLISYLLLLSGVVVLATEKDTGKLFILTSFLLGAVHWIGSMISISTDTKLAKEKTIRYFWLSLLIMVPPFAGMLYYTMDKKKIS